MTKGIILEFERGGTVFAELLEKKAPKTCRAILRALPVENKVIHAIWAGEEIFILKFLNEIDLSPPTFLLGFKKSTSKKEVSQNEKDYSFYYLDLL